MLLQIVIPKAGIVGEVIISREGKGSGFGAILRLKHQLGYDCVMVISSGIIVVISSSEKNHMRSLLTATTLNCVKK